LEQLLAEHDDLQLHLVSPLPDVSSSATKRVISSFGPQSKIDFSHCLYRHESTEAASSYIIRSETSGSRTLVNYNDLPEMTEDEFGTIAQSFGTDQETWWHFEVGFKQRPLDMDARLRVDVIGPDPTNRTKLYPSVA
jgi:ketohexokinase